jgi:hypothetical protein
MLKRAWTLVIGYMISYYTFDLRYKDGDHFLPDERISWILFGYWALILAWTIMGTLFLNAVESNLIHKFEGDQQVSQTIVWILLEVYIRYTSLNDFLIPSGIFVIQICFWYMIANWSVYEWTCIGQRFNGNPKRMVK